MTHVIIAATSHVRSTPWYQQTFPRITRLVRWLAHPKIHREPDDPTLFGRLITMDEAKTLVVPRTGMFARKVVALDAPDLDHLDVNSYRTLAFRPYYLTGDPVAAIQAPASAVGDETLYDLPVIDGVTHHERPNQLIAAFRSAHPEFEEFWNASL